MAQNVMYLHLIPPDWIDIICLGWSLLICSRARTFEGRGVLREVRGGRQAGLGLRREERASHVRCQHVIATLYLLSDAISTFAWVWQFVGRNTQVSERETSTGECISFSAQGMWNVVTRDCTSLGRSPPGLDFTIPHLLCGLTVVCMREVRSALFGSTLLVLAKTTEVNSHASQHNKATGWHQPACLSPEWISPNTTL